MNVSSPLRRNAKLFPEAPAYERSDGTVVTYDALERTVDALARRLRARSVTRGSVVAVDGGDAYRYLCTALALGRVGAAIAPVTLPEGMAAVTVAEGSGGVRHSLAFDDLWPSAAELRAGASREAIDEGGDAVFALCPSSGTTSGTPKLVALSHELMRRRVIARAMFAPFIPGTRHVCMVGPARLFGLARYLRALWAGSVVLEPELDAPAIAPWFARSGVTFMSVSPIGLNRILQCLPEEGVRGTLAMIEVSGGNLPEEIREQAMRRFHAPQIVMAYGSTETGPVASAPIAALGGRAGAVGFPLPGVEVETVDAAGRPVPRGEEGMLRVRSPHVAIGYVGDDPRAQTTFRDGWVYPSDNAIVDGDGALRITGRSDDVLNVNGVKVNTQAIEAALTSLGGLREVAVFGAPDANGMVALCAAVVPAQPLDADAFHAKCREALGRRAPVFIMHLQALPRNPMGKVMRSELARMAVDADARRNA